MSAKPSSAPSPRHSKRAEVEVVAVDDAALVRIRGMLDEHFPGFGDISARTVVIDIQGVRFITSFGVRQWLRAMSAIPPTATHVYLAGCPRIFVEQLNMILNFGGTAQILTLLAPYRCTSCGNETDESIDAVAHAGEILQGKIPEPACRKCNGKLALDELPEMYFACLRKYGPREVVPAATQLLATDTSKLQKQVLKPTIKAKPSAAAPTATRSRSSIIWTVVIGLLLAGLATGLYILVGPS